MVALHFAGSDDLAAAKARFLDASTADRTGGRHKTGVRWMVVYCVYGLGINPIQPRDADFAMKTAYEVLLEDCSIWLVTFSPSGRTVSAKSALKYASEWRSYYHRFYRPAVFGHGAEGSRIPELLRGVVRLTPQPAPLDRIGCAPQDLGLGMNRAFPAMRAGGGVCDSMWRAALAWGFVILARGCELGLDDVEAFEASEHLLPGDFTCFRAEGHLHVRARMRKRKDMKLLRGKHADVVAGGGGSYFDAAELVAEWLRVRRQAGIDETCAMFCFPDGTPIRTRDVRTAVRCAMKAAGLDPMRFGAHSLRIGGATAALAAGVSPQLIRLMGRWSSDIYEIYCRMSLQAALGVGRSIASQRVDSFESGFRTESLEMLPHEVDLIRAEEAELR